MEARVGRDAGGRGRGRSQRHSAATGTSTEPVNAVPTTVLSFHQPLASMVAYGLQRLDGRVWHAQHRGPLWIHAAAKEPSAADIAEMEEFHTAVYDELCAEVGEDEAPAPLLPTSYPTSCLLGCVTLVDCVSAAELGTWATLPAGVRQEARIHGSGESLICRTRVLAAADPVGQTRLFGTQWWVSPRT